MWDAFGCLKWEKREWLRKRMREFVWGGPCVQPLFLHRLRLEGPQREQLNWVDHFWTLTSDARLVGARQRVRGDRTDCTCHDDDDVGQAATTTTVAAAAGLAAFVSTFDSKTLNWQKGRLWKICSFNRLTVIYFAKSFFGQFAAKYFGNDFLQKIVEP